MNDVAFTEDEFCSNQDQECCEFTDFINLHKYCCVERGTCGSQNGSYSPGDCSASSCSYLQEKQKVKGKPKQQPKQKTR